MVSAGKVWIAPAMVAVLGLMGPARASVTASGQPVIAVAQGRLAGRTGPDGIQSFKDIPYARPPVGELRWRAPVAAKAWTGVRAATTFGASCIQPLGPATNIYYDPPAKMSENCLSLNVWRPAHAHNLPVIVWIYGGALEAGSSAEPMYNGRKFAEHGVVFVSFNYRLGPLGWLALPALDKESAHDVSGNYGLLDQIAALKWVRQNISVFGGNPHNVTIMGESAGALSVTYLLSSPLARGLFQKAIAESPNMRSLPDLKQAEHGLPSADEIGTRLENALHARGLKTLRAEDPKALMIAAFRTRFRPQGTIDGYVLPHQIVRIFNRGQEAHVPVLAGFNSGEIQTLKALLPPAPATHVAYEQEIRARYGNLASAFLKLYPGTDISASMLATLRDAVFGWAAEKIVRSESAAHELSYLYLFDHDYPAAHKRGLRGFHASELPFVFGAVGRQASLPPNWPRPQGPTDTALSGAMMDYWISFARTGVPAAPGQPGWPVFAQHKAYMRFDQKPVASNDPYPGMYALNSEVVTRRMQAGNQQWFYNVGVAAIPPIPSR